MKSIEKSVKAVNSPQAEKEQTYHVSLASGKPLHHFLEMHFTRLHAQPCF